MRRFKRTEKRTNYEDSPLWGVNEQIKDLLGGIGATEDHEAVKRFFANAGLPDGTVDRVHRALVCAELTRYNLKHWDGAERV